MRRPGTRRSGAPFFVARGRVSIRPIPRGAAGRLELETGLAAAAGGDVSFAPEDAADLVTVGGFLRRPPPELRILRLDVAEILAA